MPGNGFLDITITDGGGTLIMQRRVQTWGLQLSDMSTPLKQIGEDLLDDNWNNFTENGQLFAGDWAPLADSTVRDRIRKGFAPNQTLVRTGELRDGFTQRGAADNVFEVTSSSVTVGSSSVIAGYQHNGTGRIPARPLVGVTWARQTEIVRRFVDWINGLLNA